MNSYHNSLPIEFSGLTNTILGGPFKTAPNTHFRIKMAAEIKAACEVDIPTRDFDVPPVESMIAGIKKALPAILSGKDVFVGCMGGIGRTGLFMACLVKTLDPKENAVGYVRQYYKSHAVETAQQMQYVDDFPAESLRWFVRWTALKCKVAKLFGK